MADRVVQAALKLVLEPIFEADFLRARTGSGRTGARRTRSPRSTTSRRKSYHWVLEADIEACFDMIDHAALMDRVRRRISDKRVLALVKAFLKAGVMTTTGTTGGTHHRYPAGRDPLPAAGQHRPVRAG